MGFSLSILLVITLNTYIIINSITTIFVCNASKIRYFDGTKVVTFRIITTAIMLKQHPTTSNIIFFSNI
nr:MAG TPA: hypothetical protein [Caudoviricetes sp.]